MSGHNIIVMGASAGGVKALSSVVGALPREVNAAIFIVLHMPPDKPSNLPRILERAGALPCAHAQDGEKIQNGKIYVAPPDYHLLLNRGFVRVLRGPQENRFRPAIDALFRSAARAYGPKVLAVLLSGALDDGTVGQQYIKRQGGVTIVQDPDEAEFPWMPRTALRYVQVDQCVPLAEIPSVLLRLIDEPAPEGEAEPVPKEMEFEANIAEQQMNTQEFLDNVEQIGIRTSYTCPACSGSIWQIGNENPLRFRCHVGHSFTAEPFLAEQTSHIEDVLWAAVRALEEKVTLMRQLAQRMKQQGNSSVAIRYEDYAQKIDGEVSIVRELILNGFATKRNIVAGEK